MNRRDFLKLLGLAAGAVVVPKVVIDVIPEVVEESPFLESSVGGFLVPMEFQERIIEAIKAQDIIDCYTKLKVHNRTDWPLRSVRVVDYGT